MVEKFGKEQSECDVLFEEIFEKLDASNVDWQDKFIAMNWQRVENYREHFPISLRNAIYDTLGYDLLPRQQKIILAEFNDENRNFNSVKFLLRFLKAFEKFALSSQRPKSNHINRSNYWNKLKSRLKYFVVSAKFVSSMEDAARHRALSLLIETVGKSVTSRFGPTVVPFGLAELPKSEFRR
jgi:uncharacterized protein YdiU (UPF0061 family)